MGAKRAALEARVEALEGAVAALITAMVPPSPYSQREPPPIPWPDPLDVAALAAVAVVDYSHYIDPDIWGPSRYL